VDGLESRPPEQVLLRLDRPALCCECHDALDVGVTAQWDRRLATVTCLRCLDHPGAARTGPPGGSGAAEARRRVSSLDEMGGAVTVLDRRCVQGEPTPIDHLITAPTGVWVVHDQRWRGRVAWHPAPTTDGPRLIVNGRDATRHLIALDRQLRQVRRALLEHDCADVDARGVLCFVDCEVPLRQRQTHFGPHLVTWPRGLRRCLQDPGPLEKDAREAITQVLASAFPPMSGR